MNGVFIIPTGIGAEIGGHAGDANPVVKLISTICDKLIIHPNVVNASDINEMPDNALYVEGSILDRFLEGSIQLKEVNQNKILVVANAPLRGDTVNAVSAGRATIGIDAEILELKTPLKMIATMKDGKATGKVLGWEELVGQVRKYDFDALAIHTPINVSEEIALNYFKNGGINPWGGVEAKASKLISTSLNKPVAHAPLENKAGSEEMKNIIYKVVDPRIAPEIISNCFFHCVLKGLNRAPRIGEGIKVDDIDFMISPYGCVGRPHLACLEHNIPVIVVKENKTVLNQTNDNFIEVENYWEAVGIIAAMKAGISPASVRRPIKYTTLIGKEGNRLEDNIYQAGIGPSN